MRMIHTRQGLVSGKAGERRSISQVGRADWGYGAEWSSRSSTRKVENTVWLEAREWLGLFSGEVPSTVATELARARIRKQPRAARDVRTIKLPLWFVVLLMTERGYILDFWLPTPQIKGAGESARRERGTDRGLKRAKS